MKRQSYKYIFYLNFIFIAVCACITFFSSTEKSSSLPVSMTTPLINTSTISQDFCSSARSAVIIDAKSGAVLFEKNKDTRLPMASTTKIITALAVIENASPDDVITVSPKAAATEGSSIYLKAGEKISVRDLLYGLLLESGNDAAMALAEGCFGSVEKCVEKLNEICHREGLIDTHIQNPSGLDSESHYTTAYELARITSTAMKNPLFREIVSTKSYTAKGENMRYFSNHNRLLKTFEGVIGVKTGYTSKSGRCLVTCAEKDGESYIAVTLHDPSDWQDHRQMLTYAFTEYDSIEVAEREGFEIYRGFEKFVPVEDIFITTHGQNDFKINYKISFDKESAGVDYYCGGSKFGFFALCEKVPPMPQEERSSFRQNQ